MSTQEKQPRIRAATLTLSSYTKWKTYILEWEFSYGAPGKAIAIREPTREDRNHFESNEINHEEEYVALLNERIGDNQDINAMNSIEDDLRQEFLPICRSDILFEWAYKQYSRKLEEIETETSKIICFILETITDDAKKKLLLQAIFEIAKDTNDVILLWRTIDDVYAHQGQFSSTTIRAK